MHDIAPRIDTLIDAYIDFSIEDEQFAALCGWLREGPEHRRAFARKLALHSEIAEWCIERSGGHLAGHLDTPEAEAELPTIRFTEPETQARQEYVSALSYVLRHTFTPKRVAALAMAAALLLGVVLATVLLSGPDDNERVVGAPDQPTPIAEAPSAQRVVATLTAERDARWDRRPGRDLYAGERFTLTQGFAEITTQRGAVAILEGPSSIELVDHDNSIRLHDGRLIGICESDSSKGFVVKTANADVVDLGTEFGVSIDPQGMMLAQVFEGSVALSPTARGTDSRPTTLIAGEASRVDRDGAITDLSPDPKAFARLLDSELLLTRRAGYARWLEYSEALRRDPAIVAYYGFTAGDERQNKLQNLAHVTAGGLHGLFLAGVNNSPTWVAGRFPEKRGLRFDRTKAQWVSVPHDDRLNPHEAITIACWINRAGEGEQGGIFVCKSDRPGLISYQLGGFDGKSTPHSKKIQFVTGRVRQGARESTARVFEATDRWEHLAVVYDSKVVRFYHNGEPAGTAPMTLSMPATSAELRIGQHSKGFSQGSNPFGGVMDELVILSRVMDEGEINRMYEAGLPKPR